MKVLAGPELIQRSDIIVRAEAVDYARQPADRALMTTGVPDSRIHFRVIEVLKGESGNEVFLPGYLGMNDDFNDQSPPYTFVRRNGRSGSCYANTYRTGAEYLLLMIRTREGGYTVNWSALSPVNEQLRGASDPWLVWVKEQRSALAPPR